MSLFLSVSYMRCAIRTTTNIKRFFLANHGFTVREGLRIRYFFPRTEDAYESTRPTKSTRKPKSDLVSVGKGSRVIYQLPSEDILQAVTFSAVIFFTMTVYFFFNLEYISPSAENEEKGADPTSEEATSDDHKLVKQDDIPDVPLIKPLFAGDPKQKLAFAITLIVFFFFVRSRVVLTIFRNDTDFITVFYQPLGFGKKLTEHQAKCRYYPNKKVFQHNLLGKNVIIFPELFINELEESIYTDKDDQEINLKYECINKKNVK